MKPAVRIMLVQQIAGTWAWSLYIDDKPTKGGISDTLPYAYADSYTAMKGVQDGGNTNT